MKAAHRIAILVLAGWLHSSATAAECAPRNAAASSLRHITDVMAKGRFIAYQPTQLHVIDGKLTQVSARSIEADLRILRPRFDGLITYGSLNGAEKIPDVAARLGFRAIIMGIWDTQSRTEIDNVVAAAKRQPQIVVGVSFGNERILARQKQYSEVAATLASAQQLVPQLAITTTEPFHIFENPAAAPVLQHVDFMLVNVHPAFQPWFQSAPLTNAAQFVDNVTVDLRKRFCGPILVKETGVPTAPLERGYTPQKQRDFYLALQKQLPPRADRAFAYFAAFDAPWRVKDEQAVPGDHPEEAFWGLYTESRQPKPVVNAIESLKGK